MSATRMMNARRRKACAALLSALLSVTLGGCAASIGLPVDGPVQTFAPVQREDHRVFTDPQGPLDDAQPEDIVEGFFSAMPAGVQNDGYRVAKRFLAGEAGSGWDGDAGTVVFSGNPTFVRHANTLDGGETGNDSSVVISVELQTVGRLDDHGLYTASRADVSETFTYTLTKIEGQWRITSLPDGVMISDTDFDQAYRQTTLYYVSAASDVMIPDVRWLSWRNWRTRAVEELLRGGAAWLDGAYRRTNTSDVKLNVNAVPVDDGVAQIELTEGFLQLNELDRALLVRQLRLTLSDGAADGNIAISVGGKTDYADADDDVTIPASSITPSAYTLTLGNIVSLNSASPLRVGATSGFEDARSFVFSENGGAVLRSDGIAECLKADGSSCGTLFGSGHIGAITGGNGNDIWAVDADGDTLYRSNGDGFQQFDLPWLTDGRVSDIAISPEGSRMALAVDAGSWNGVVMLGIGGGSSVSLSDTPIQVSCQNGIAMLTFYNDTTLVYASGAVDDDGRSSQRAYRQLGPGLEVAQELPDNTITQMSVGRVSATPRLLVLDVLGRVRAASGSLDGSWSVADSQVTAIANR